MNANQNPWQYEIQNRDLQSRWRRDRRIQFDRQHLTDIFRFDVSNGKAGLLR